MQVKREIVKYTKDLIQEAYGNRKAIRFRTESEFNLFMDICNRYCMGINTCGVRWDVYGLNDTAINIDKNWVIFYGSLSYYEEENIPVVFYDVDSVKNKREEGSKMAINKVRETIINLVNGAFNREYAIHVPKEEDFKLLIHVINEDMPHINALKDRVWGEYKEDTAITIDKEGYMRYAPKDFYTGVFNLDIETFEFKLDKVEKEVNIDQMIKLISVILNSYGDAMPRALLVDNEEDFKLICKYTPTIDKNIWEKYGERTCIYSNKKFGLGIEQYETLRDSNYLIAKFDLEESGYVTFDGMEEESLETIKNSEEEEDMESIIEGALKTLINGLEGALKDHSDKEEAPVEEGGEKVLTQDELEEELEELFQKAGDMLKDNISLKQKIIASLALYNTLNENLDLEIFHK